MNENGHMYIMAKKTKEYVSHLHKHNHDLIMTKIDQMIILEWTKTKMAQLPLLD